MINFLDESITELYPLLKKKFDSLNQNPNNDKNAVFTDEYINDCCDGLIVNLATETYYNWCELIKHAFEKNIKKPVQYGTVYYKKTALDKIDLNLTETYKTDTVYSRLIIFSVKADYKDIKNYLKNDLDNVDETFIDYPPKIFYDYVPFAQNDYIGTYDKKLKTIPLYQIINYNDPYPLITPLQESHLLKEKKKKTVIDEKENYAIYDLDTLEKFCSEIYYEILFRIIRKAVIIKKALNKATNLEQIFEIITDTDKFLPENIKNIEKYLTPKPKSDRQKEIVVQYPTKVVLPTFTK